ncbi:MAG TPA: putative Na+/H+ antiporter [Roseateles sp.]|nr:putative Na+/H+ antiporter [Roseateles sp.]HWT53536.1 putative Na+/H+ antiporter [Rhodocyclaceae bacterium]
METSLAPTSTQLIGAVLFAIAILHTFSTKFFEGLAHKHARHAGIWHLLAEVEVVFGFWAMVLMVAMFAFEGKASATSYIDSRNFTEPLFVFAIMVVAGTRPVLEFAKTGVRIAARFVPLPRSNAYYFTLLTLGPLLGSFITEPAAMTLTALILRDRYFLTTLSPRFMYATLGVLFVNISIGGTLTPFAAPPVLMVASTWQWDIAFMLAHFGWKAALAVTFNALLITLIFRKELTEVPVPEEQSTAHVPFLLTVTHLLFLAGVVVFSHHPAVFMGLLLFFLGIAHAYERHQEPLILREGLLVAFFLAGLVVLGGQQEWWLKPVLLAMSPDQVYFGATALTAITDNAALTYLGSLVDGLSPEFKYSLVAGAVTGGGLTVIANAPNPAGFSILRERFTQGVIHPLGLLLAALPPTLVAVVAFRLL